MRNVHPQEQCVGEKTWAADRGQSCAVSPTGDGIGAMLVLIGGPIETLTAGAFQYQKAPVRQLGSFARHHLRPFDNERPLSGGEQDDFASMVLLKRLEIRFNCIRGSDKSCSSFRHRSFLCPDCRRITVELTIGGGTFSTATGYRESRNRGCESYASATDSWRHGQEDIATGMGSRLRPSSPLEALRPRRYRSLGKGCRRRG